MKALAIAYSNLRRMLRDRSSIFFVFIFPDRQSNISLLLKTCS